MTDHEQQAGERGRDAEHPGQHEGAHRQTPGRPRALASRRCPHRLTAIGATETRNVVAIAGVAMRASSIATSVRRLPRGAWLLSGRARARRRRELLAREVAYFQADQAARA